jgi:hypothetical protein
MATMRRKASTSNDPAAPVIDSLQTPYSRGWATAWLGVVVLASVNGVLHRLYVGSLGELRAHQVSTLVLLILLAPSGERSDAIRFRMDRRPYALACCGRRPR